MAKILIEMPKRGQKISGIVSENLEIVALYGSAGRHVIDIFDAAHPLNIPFQLNGINSHFDLYSLSIAESANEEMPTIHITVPWNPSTEGYSECETQMTLLR